MHHPIRTAIEGRFPSFDELARELIETYKGTGKPLNHRSLGAKIGRLNKGDTTWWLSRPKLLEALLGLVGLSEADVGIHANATDGLFTFEHFPALPPLDLRRERFCDIASPKLVPDGSADLDLWFDHGPRSLHRVPTSTVWLHVPPGTGRSALLATLASSGRYDVLVKNTLADARERLRGSQPVVIAISTDGGTQDLLTLALRPENAGTLIIAPFAASTNTNTDPLEAWSWEGMTAEGEQRQLLFLSNPISLHNGIQPVQWQLHTSWRKSLLAWVEDRLSRHGSDTLFSSTVLDDWLNTFDPLQEWIRTPADLMALCRVTHDSPKIKLPKRSAEDAGQKLLAVLTLAGPGEKALFSRLACARWEDFTQPWREALPYATWEQLAPATPSRADLLAIVEETNLQVRRSRVTRLTGQRDTAGLRLLTDAGLLSRDAKGCFDLEPRVLADLAVRDHLVATIKEGQTDGWGMACFDPGRRATIDAALDALEGDELLAAAGGVLAGQCQTAAVIAVAEALFCAVGRRLLQGGKLPDQIRALASVVVPRLPLAECSWRLPAPWTRPLSIPKERCEWLAVCWAWSVGPRPGIPDIAEQSSWLFPGCCDLLPEPPFWLYDLTAPSDSDTHLAAWTDVLKVGEALVRLLTVPVPEAPPLLHGGLLAASVFDKWDAQSCWWAAVHADHTMAEKVLTQLKHRGHPGAIKLWPSLIAHEATADSTDNIRARFSPIRKWILEQLDPKEVLAELNPGERSYMVANAFLMPPAVRRTLLDSLDPEELDVDIRSVICLFKACGAEGVSCLVRWLKTTHGYLAASWMWQHDPQFTLQWLEDSAASHVQLAELVLDTCPTTESAGAASLLLRYPTLLGPEARHGWVRERLPGSGTAATALVALLG